MLSASEWTRFNLCQGPVGATGPTGASGATADKGFVNLTSGLTNVAMSTTDFRVPITANVVLSPISSGVALVTSVTNAFGLKNTSGVTKNYHGIATAYVNGTLNDGIRMAYGTSFTNASPSVLTPTSLTNLGFTDLETAANEGYMNIHFFVTLNTNDEVAVGIRNLSGANPINILNLTLSLIEI